MNYFDVKGDLEALSVRSLLRQDLSSCPAPRPVRQRHARRPGKSGFLGELHPQWVQKYELAGSGSGAPVVFELDLEAWLAVAMPTYGEVSRFPGVTRDLALTVAREQALGPLLDALRKAGPAFRPGGPIVRCVPGQRPPRREKKPCVPHSYARYCTDFGGHRRNRCGNG